MKYLRLFIPLFIISCGSLRAEELKFAYYILPRGTPFVQIGLSSGKMERAELSFGDRLLIISDHRHGDIVWYQCARWPSIFYLPESFVTEEPAALHTDISGSIPIGSASIDRWTPISIFYMPKDLVSLPDRYKAKGYEEREMLLREEAAQNFIRLMEDAEEEGIEVRVLSAFRDARYQSYLYQRAVQKQGIFQDGVAKPGHSEHQLGTVCDLTSVEIRYSMSLSFHDTRAFRWLNEHTAFYGIALSYPQFKGGVTGYKYEPWHYRYWGEGRWKHFKYRYGIFFTP
jgi:LAS superfamily LD-carboxypeptidase LdcB